MKNVVCIILGLLQSAVLMAAGSININSRISENVGKMEGRSFIAHRGVNMGCTIAGENSLEAIHLAKRAGFATVETDVRLTSDSILVIMHDNTLNRTCLNVDGTELKENVYVSENTLKELKFQYRLKATELQNRTEILTLHEYLVECKKCGFVPFIEPKLNDGTGLHYKAIIKEADEVMGINNYVITSNNLANETIRNVGLKKIPLMGILYQTTYEKIESLGNIIMGISTSKFTEKDYRFYVSKAKSSNLRTESHADNFSRFTMINNNDIDYVSTDYLAPDLKDNSLVLVAYEDFKDYEYTGQLTDGIVTLSTNDTLSLKTEFPEVYFGGLYIEIEVKGSCDVNLGNQKFSIKNSESKTYKHQVMIYHSSPEFGITATDQCTIKSIRLKLAKY